MLFQYLLTIENTFYFILGNHDIAYSCYYPFTKHLIEDNFRVVMIDSNLNIYSHYHFRFITDYDDNKLLNMFNENFVRTYFDNDYFNDFLMHTSTAINFLKSIIDNR